MNETTININDIFWTFQGEGLNCGRRALFIRLPFCNLSCSWCDTEFNTFKPLTQGDFAFIATSEKAKFAVITGGEPTMNKHVSILIGWLKDLGFEIAMESNGTFAPPNGVDHLTVSPKREQKQLPPYYIHPLAFEKAAEFKYVVDNNFDFMALDAVKDSKARKYLSPEFGAFQSGCNKIFHFIKENPEWSYSIQTHKFMGIK